MSIHFCLKNRLMKYMLILNQLLWYILEDFDHVINHCHALIETGGHLFISNAFAREQRYGKSIIDGFGGLYTYFSRHQHFSIVEAHFYDENTEHMDGHLILKRC
mgnify:CR=1 FL=1